VGLKMQVAISNWKKNSGWSVAEGADLKANLVIFFGQRSNLENGQCFADLKSRFPQAKIAGCTTGGQIWDGEVDDDVVTAMAIRFDATKVELVSASATDLGSSFEAGKNIGRQLMREDLRGIIILSDGLSVNGSELTAGMNSIVCKSVIITGGLAGDGALFKETLVWADQAPRQGQIAAIGLYGNAIQIGCGNAGGWDEFGPKRKITASKGNILQELDGQPALKLYKKYLGEEAADLPGSALLFPLLVYDPADLQHKVIRTVLAVDEASQSMTFAGDMPVGWTTQLMKGQFDRLTESAAEAVAIANSELKATYEDTATLLISCIGRRILMGEYVIDEVLASQSAMLRDSKMLGFYSYGEISPHAVSGMCELHNQTMTVTVFSEIAA
jgi:hypothetical protein